MTSARKAAKTTATLVVLIIGITILMRWCETLSDGFIYQTNLLLNSKSQIGGYHSFIVSLSFWLLLISSGIDAVFKGKSGVYIIDSFGVPITFSLCVAVWGLAAVSTQVNIDWFWLFYYVGLIICIRIAYGRISNIKGAGPSKIILFLKSAPSKNDSEVSIIDRCILYVTKVVMLMNWFALILSCIIFCAQYNQIFRL